MSDLADTTLPYARLRFDGAEKAALSLETPIEAEAAGALLARVVRRAAEAAADGAAVSPVTLSIDVTGPVEAAGAIDFAARIDRKTRTLVFAGGEARAGGAVILTASCVYKIV